MRNSFALKALSLVLGLVFAACVHAEDNRYKAWIDDNVLYRFDNQTAEICKLIKPATGPAMWVKCDVVETKPAAVKIAATQIPAARYQPEIATPFLINPGRTQGPLPQQSAPVAILDGNGPANDPAPKKTSARRIELFNDLGVNITDEIDDQMRAESRALINGYDKLNVSHNFKINGDHISGIVFIDNKGDKHISLMEITMFIRVVGKEKPIEHKRFIFASNKPEADRPPAPSNGSSGLSVMKKIDIATPMGVIHGMPDLRVTYLKFEE